jgi:hypothetical protein
MSEATHAAESPPTPELPGAIDRQSQASSPRILLGAAALGLGVLVFLLGANWMNEWLFGPFAFHATPLAASADIGGINHTRVHTVIVSLGSFFLASQWYERRRLPVDLLRLEPLTVPPPGGFRAFALREVAMPRRALLASAVGGGLIGVAVYLGSAAPNAASVTASDEPAHLIWALLTSALLMAVMIHSAQRMWVAHRALVRIVSRIDSLPFLDSAAFAPFAHIGIRNAFYWAAASSIASILALDLSRLTPRVIFLVATLVAATAALFGPAQTVHRRIFEAKKAELANVRERIGQARDAALGPEPGAAEAGASMLPGLLAWETRVSAVREWPFDPSTWVRFGAIVLLATGSWLGGAVVERVLSAVLD